MIKFFRKRTACFFSFIFLIAMGVVSPVLASETVLPDASTTPEPQNVSRKLEELKKLKQQDPATFDRMIRERKRSMKTKLNELKEKDPQKFQELKEKIRKNRQQYLKKLRKENPQKFQELMQTKMQKLEALKQSNPEKYKRLIKNQPQLAGHLQKQRGTEPEASAPQGENGTDHVTSGAHAGSSHI